MTIDEAIEVLRQHNEWRLGGENCPATGDVTKAIRLVCDFLDTIKAQGSSMRDYGADVRINVILTRAQAKEMGFVQ